MRVVMRVGALILALLLASFSGTCGRAKPDASVPVSRLSAHKTETAASPSAASKVDFDTQIRPILQSSCTPCHFAGGAVYQRLPFDRPETIYKLGTKLFTRIKDEKEQRLIREFLSQQSE